ncbi:MAG: histidine kinase [Saprospiraceae bacterium]|nr:MAG: histidine kinase [Saprospiraceae bacterium]
MEKQTQKYPSEWVYHIIFWVVYWVFASMQDVVYIPQFRENFNLPMVFGSMGVVYFNYYYWIPKYLIHQKRHWFYSFSIIGIIVANAFLVILLMQLFSRKAEFYFWERVFTLGVDTTVLVAFTTAFKFIVQWHERNNYAITLEKKSLENELEMLRSQINPHFIFNTLNTIYFLLEQKEDEKAKEALLKFSDTLSHQLYDYNKDFIDLSQEVEYLKNYIELQKLRCDEELLDLRVSLPQQVNGYKIAPMLLIPFVENAFKHGSNSKGYFVSVSLTIDDGVLHFRTENTINPTRRTLRSEREGGIGLNNVKRRLEITYPNRHQLELQTQNGTYIADLKIQLDENSLPGNR